jgi:multicomponent Na+:H+ antiporter subunit D
VNAVVALAVLVPMGAACVLAATSPIGRRGPAAALAIAAVATSAVLLAIVLHRVHAGRLVIWWGAWTPGHGRVIGVDFAIDGLGAGLALFVAVLGVPALIMAAYAIRASAQLFFAACLIFITAMIGFSLTGDLFNLFVFFELMSVSAYVLVGYEIHGRAPLEGALTFAVTNSVGSILMLFGIGMVYGRTGALNMVQIAHALGAAGPSPAVLVSFALIATGLLVKAAVVPFHFWTADAYGVAPTPVLILLAGVFSEMGLYGLARVYWAVFEPALGGHQGTILAILVVLGLLTAVLGAAMALAQHHVKRLLAFVVVSQIGLFLVGIGLLRADGLAGTAIFVVGDGLAKAALFICVGVVQRRSGASGERALHGAGRALWPLGLLYGVAALVVADLPPFGSFAGRSLVEDAALHEPGWRWVPAVMALVSALAGGALLRVGLRMFAGVGERAVRDARFSSEGSAQDETDEQPVRSRGPGILAGALLVAALVWGLLPGLAESVTGAAARFTDTAGYAAAVLGGAAPGPSAVPAVHGPGATAYLYALASLAGAAAVAALGAWNRTPPAWAMRGVNAVRDLHSGRAGDYVAWTGAGALALAGLLALTVR